MSAQNFEIRINGIPLPGVSEISYVEPRPEPGPRCSGKTLGELGPVTFTGELRMTPWQKRLLLFALAHPGAIVPMPCFPVGGCVRVRHADGYVEWP